MRDFPAHGFFFFSCKYEANICSGTGIGKEGFSDCHCRMRDRKQTRVFRDHEFIATSVIHGFSSELQCSAPPEKAMSKMDGWVQLELRFSQTIVIERPSDNSISMSDKWQEHETRSCKTNV